MCGGLLTSIFGGGDKSTFTPGQAKKVDDEGVLPQATEIKTEADKAQLTLGGRKKLTGPGQDTGPTGAAALAINPQPTVINTGTPT